MEEMNNKAVSDMQNENSNGIGKSLKDRIIEIDKYRTDKTILSDLDLENIEKNKKLLKRAEMLKELNYDEVKDLNKLINYSKIAGIRERQIEKKKADKQEYGKFDIKSDVIMELNRLQELKAEEEVEAKKKEERYLGKVVITEQIKERERKRVIAKEQLEVERLEMVKKIEELVKEEKEALEKKRIESDKLSKQVAIFNRNNEGKRERKKQDERDLDKRMLQYQIDLGVKEEMELAEKK